MLRGRGNGRRCYLFLSILGTKREAEHKYIPFSIKDYEVVS